MKSQLFDIRREYKKGRLTPGNLNDKPLEQFDHRLNDAIHSDEYEPTAMTVATASTDGHPSTRTVLLKGVENGRFIFFTNYESRKGRQLTANPYISLSIVWHKLERQIHIEGKAESCAPADSDSYFASRPYICKFGARISPHSLVIGSRMEIMRAFVREAATWVGLRIKRPDNWGGFAVTPFRFEFWQGRESRLHDRFLYSQQADGSWKKERLAH